MLQAPVPKIYFILIIHNPGLGKIFSVLGATIIKKYGIPNPKPNAVNMKIVYKSFWVKAKLIAVPKNGAEQGVARAVEIIPVKKAEIYLFLKSTLFNLLNIDGIKISKTPIKLSEKKNSISENINKNSELWNCIPHPTSLPNVLNRIITIPNKINEKRIPAAVANEENKILFLSSLFRFISE